MHQNRFALIVALAACSLACSGADKVDIGENQPSKTGETLSDFAAAWDGYAEAYTFDSGSDHMQIVLDAAGNGYVEVGDGTPPAPPTDPDVGYPTEDAANNYQTPSSSGLWEGFHYTVQNAKVEARRIQFAIEPKELFKDWCELQTPVPTTDNSGYGCLPDWPAHHADGMYYIDDPDDASHSVLVDAGKFELCHSLGYPCTCAADGCTVPPIDSASARTRLDAALEDGGNTLVGTFTLDGDPTVRLERH